MKFVLNNRSLVKLDDGDVWAWTAFKAVRTGAQLSCQWLKETEGKILEFTMMVNQNKTNLPLQVRKAEQMRRAVTKGLNKDDIDRNCFEILISLSSKGTKKADDDDSKTCPICFDVLGGTYNKALVDSSKKLPPNIAMVHCKGPHFLCATCLDDFNRRENNLKKTCIECRQAYHPVKDVTLIKLDDANLEAEEKKREETKFQALKELKEWVKLLSGEGKGRFDWQAAASKGAFDIVDLPTTFSCERIPR